jgi:hypothetical protein
MSTEPQGASNPSKRTTGEVPPPAPGAVMLRRYSSPIVAMLAQMLASNLPSFATQAA